jgi:outer membrane receptor protein involved in Fe transport
MKISYALLYLLLALYIAPFRTSAQESAATADTLIDLNEVLITGSKQYRSAGNVTQRIDLIPIRQADWVVSGNNNLAEVLQQKPGVSVAALSRNDANWGTYAGIGPKYSTFMLNGLPLDAFVDPQALDLLAIERIEIQRGPASVLYPNYLSQDFAGNQSPLAGTVNLILKERVELRQTLAALSYGSFNTLTSQLLHQDRAGGLHYFGGLNYEISDYTNYGTENSWLNMQKDPQYRRARLFAGGSLFYGEKEQHKLGFFINHTLHQGDAGRVYRGFGHQYTTINATHTSALSENLSLHAGMGVRIYDRSWQESFFNVVDSLLSNNGVYQKIIPADLNFAWKHGAGSLLTLGADYQSADYYTTSDPLLGYEQYGNRSTAMQYGVYAQEELRLGALLLRAGLRYNYVRNTIDLISGGKPGLGEQDWGRLLWSGGLKYAVSSRFSLYANAGNSFLTPGLKSIGGTLALSDLGVPGRNGQLPNPDLRPESGLGLDAGTQITPIEGMSLSLRAFYLSIDDAIVENAVSQNPSQSQSVNAGTSSSLGFEAEISQRLGRSMTLFANYTYMQTSIENPFDEDQDGANVPFAPNHVANAGLQWQASGWTLYPFLNYNGGYYDSSSLKNRAKFTPGALINLFVSKELSRQERYGLEAFARLYNVTDNRFEMPWQFQNTGFAVTVGLKVVLK